MLGSWASGGYCRDFTAQIIMHIDVTEMLQLHSFLNVFSLSKDHIWPIFTAECIFINKTYIFYRTCIIYCKCLLLKDARWEVDLPDQLCSVAKHNVREREREVYCYNDVMLHIILRNKICFTNISLFCLWFMFAGWEFFEELGWMNSLTLMFLHIVLYIIFPP